MLVQKAFLTKYSKKEYYLAAALAGIRDVIIFKIALTSVLMF